MTKYHSSNDVVINITTYNCSVKDGVTWKQTQCKFGSLLVTQTFTVNIQSSYIRILITTTEAAAQGYETWLKRRIYYCCWCYWISDITQYKSIYFIEHPDSFSHIFMYHYHDFPTQEV